MEDILKKFQQTAIAEISKTRNSVFNELKVINENIESLTGNTETEQDLYYTRKVEDLKTKLQQTVFVIDEMLDTRDFVSGEFKAFNEKIQSLKDGKAETIEGMFCTREVEEFLKNLHQTIIEKMSKTHIFISGELEVINERIGSLKAEKAEAERIESLKVEKAETKLGMDFFDLYAQESLIGEGSMGRMYKVRDLETEKVCALICIGLEENLITPKVVREISKLFDIKYNSIVKNVHACEGSLYIIMEYVGDDFSTFLQKGGKIDAEITEIFSPAMEEPVKEKIRIVMSSRSLKAVDEATAECIRIAKGMCLTVWGPCRVPTQVVDIKTRLAPCPKGSSPYGNFKLRLYGATIDVLSSTKVVEEIISGSNVGDVEIEIIIVNPGGRSP